MDQKHGILIASPQYRSFRIENQEEGKANEAYRRKSGEVPIEKKKAANSICGLAKNNYAAEPETRLYRQVALICVFLIRRVEV